LNPGETVNKTVPVQILVETKDINNNQNTDYYSITQFKPYLTLQEEDYNVNIIYFYFLNVFHIIRNNKLYY
jgi:hypothetical protein